MAVSANWLHSPSRLCHREGAFTQFTFQNGQESRKWLTIQICHVLNAWEAKKPLYGTKNLSKGAKTRVRVLADIQNFALRAHCVRTACMAFPWDPDNRKGARRSPETLTSPHLSTAPTGRNGTSRAGLWAFFWTVSGAAAPDHRARNRALSADQKIPQRQMCWWASLLRVSGLSGGCSLGQL